MLSIRTILAPTDFSTHAAVALRYACGLAERLGAKMHLLHVLPDVVPAGPDVMLAPALPPEYYAATEKESLEALKNLLDPTWGAISSPEVAVHWGEPVDGIVEYARKNEIDLIVIATHGRTGLSHVLLGSVAERIVREASCPVLTVRDRST